MCTHASLLREGKEEGEVERNGTKTLFKNNRKRYTKRGRERKRKMESDFRIMASE